jgi:hypothetical protein
VDYDTLMAVTSYIGGTIVAGRKHFPDRTPPVEDDSLFARLTTVGSGKGNGAKFPRDACILAKPLTFAGISNHRPRDTKSCVLIGEGCPPLVGR